ncbi:MAG: hypothetical protein ACRBBN_07205 [Methyloligellaceae bacterium]
MVRLLGVFLAALFLFRAEAVMADGYYICKSGSIAGIVARTMRRTGKIAGKLVARLVVRGLLRPERISGFVRPVYWGRRLNLQMHIMLH